MYTYGHTRSLHDGLPIAVAHWSGEGCRPLVADPGASFPRAGAPGPSLPCSHRPQGRGKRQIRPLALKLKIGRAHVCTPVANAHLVCRLLLKKNTKNKSVPASNRLIMTTNERYNKT